MGIIYVQVRVFKTARQVPKELAGTMTLETFESARVYGLDKAEYSVLKSILMNVFIVTLEIYFGFIPYIWQESKLITENYLNLDSTNEMIVSCVFMLVMSVIGTIKEMPFTVYSTFVLEEKHGFNKQTAGFFVKDQVKSWLVSNALSLPIACAVIYIVSIGGPYFFVWLWAFVGVVSLLFLTIYPIFIAPLFDKYSPLAEGPLRTSIEQLASRLKFPLTQLYVVEGSKRSAHSNAYFYGLWSSKRIVLFDTLLINKGEPIVAAVDDKQASGDEEKSSKGCKDSEVLAVLAHELGHWQLGHVTKNIVIMQVHLFLMFAAFGYLFNYGTLYEAFGFPEGERPVLIGLLLICNYILAAYNAVISFGMTVLSRKFEYEADAFAKKLGYATELGKALMKLNIDNLGFPVYDWLYSAWNHSHPSMLQRLARLDETKKSS